MVFLGIPRDSSCCRLCKELETVVINVCPTGPNFVNGSNHHRTLSTARPPEWEILETVATQGSTGFHRATGNPRKTYFYLFFGIFGVFLIIKVFGQNNLIVELLRQKRCKIIRSFRQNTISGPETCRI